MTSDQWSLTPWLLPISHWSAAHSLGADPRYGAFDYGANGALIEAEARPGSLEKLRERPRSAQREPPLVCFYRLVMVFQRIEPDAQRGELGDAVFDVVEGRAEHVAVLPADVAVLLQAEPVDVGL